ncbi:hypothetical protein BHM03_00035721 [Ensete ventricosum]|nr:hypothetical protein BHM03_00035721 [Ensete ventricosum]
MPPTAPSSVDVASSSAVASPASRYPLLPPLSLLLPTTQLCRRHPHQPPATHLPYCSPCCYYRYLFPPLPHLLLPQPQPLLARHPTYASSSSLVHHRHYVAHPSAAHSHCSPNPTTALFFLCQPHSHSCRCRLLQPRSHQLPLSLSSPIAPLPAAFYSHFYCYHHLLFQPSIALIGTHFLYSHTKYNVIDAMAMDDALDARFKALKARIEDRLQELLRELRRCRSESPNKTQHCESSNLKGSRSEKYDHRQDTGYPRMRVKFPRWEDGDPIDWISRAEIFFYFRRTLEESNVDIASIQLEENAIQWYDLYETYHRVLSC